MVGWDLQVGEKRVVREKVESPKEQRKQEVNLLC